MENAMNIGQIESYLGSQSEYLLGFNTPKISKAGLHLPSGSFIDDIFAHSDRSIQTLKSLNSLFNHGRLGGTGYVSILPVDQGIEHSAGASFAKKPRLF
jgi:class I fructose-bisphosphate aldolase